MERREDAEITEEVLLNPIERWKRRHKEFSKALQRGKMVADAAVAESLLRRALGYSHPEERIFHKDGKIIRAKTTKHYPPDTSAASLWLRNRQPDNWRGKPVPPARSADEPTIIEIVKL